MDAFLQVPMDPWNTAAGAGQRLVLISIASIWVLGMIHLVIQWRRAVARARREQAEQMAKSLGDISQQLPKVVVAMNGIATAALNVAAAVSGFPVLRDRKNPARESE